MSNEQVTIPAKELARLRRRRPLALNLIFLVAVGVASAWMTELHYLGSGGPIEAIGLPTLLVLLGLTIPLGWIDVRRRRADPGATVPMRELMRPSFELVALLALCFALAHYAELELASTRRIAEHSPVSVPVLLAVLCVCSLYLNPSPGGRRHPGPRYWLVVLGCSAAATAAGLALALTYPQVPFFSPGVLGVLLVSVGVVGVLGASLGLATACARAKRSRQRSAGAA